MNQLNLLSIEEIEEVMNRFEKANPNPKCELDWKNPYTLLVSVVLSAQATDKSVNENTKELFKIADTPEKMLALGRERLIEFIRPIGLSNNKSKNIIALSEKLVSDFGGEVPRDREKLMSLPGVGRKTANVVLNVVWNEPTMPVDTHLLRICPKIGLAEGDTPEKVERSLLARIPERFMLHAHHWLILHGRYVCTARKPNCAECLIGDVCKKNEIQ
jgi:endonuclease-3